MLLQPTEVWTEILRYPCRSTDPATQRLQCEHIPEPGTEAGRQRYHERAGVSSGDREQPSHHTR